VFDGLGNIFEDPMFDDPELLTLQSGSPCLEAGTKFYACKCGNMHACPDHDMEGNGRPQGSQVDMGAYEYLYVGLEEPAVGSQQSAVSAYPNPTHSTIEFRLSSIELQQLSLRIYNVQGQEVAVVLDEEMAAGEHTVRWDASGLPAGIYYYRLQTADRRPLTGTGKIMKY